MIIWFGIMYYALSSDPNEALDICVSGILFDVIRGLVRRIGSALDNDTIEVVDELPPEHRARGEAGDENSAFAQGARHGRHHIHPQGIAFAEQRTRERGTLRCQPIEAILRRLRL